MSGSQNARILAGRPAVDFIGRTDETERLLASARSSDGILVLSAPGAGATELLKQTYDRLFREQQDVVPFYFAIKPTFSCGREIAQSFLDEFIRQLIAFRRQDPTIVRSAYGLDELAELALTIGGFWIDRLIQNARGVQSADDRSAIRACLGGPIRAAAAGERSVLLVDNLQELSYIDGGMQFFDELRELFSDADVSFVACGHRRFLHGTMDRARLELDNLDFGNAPRLVEVLAKDDDVRLSDEARDLVATQLRGNPRLIAHLVRTAKDRNLDLDSFENVENAYAHALFGGRVGREFDRVFARSCADPEVEKRAGTLLYAIQTTEPPRLERELFQRRLQLDAVASEALLNRLNVSEMIRMTPAHVETMNDSIALTDYIAMRHRLSISDSRASAFGDSLTDYIKRAPELMAHRYRANWSIGIREVLGAFAGQPAPSVLIDYAAFKKELKGLPEEQALLSVKTSPPVALPRIFFTTTASAFYRPIAKIAEDERSAIALGFEAGEHDGDADIVWIAAEIDSKLEASAELVEFWCDRLEAAAVMCDFERYKIWLIAPEGFTPDALQVLLWRNAYGSSRRQVDLLRRFLDAPPRTTSDRLADNEYEMVIPMGDDAELIAAHAVEELAKRHNFDSKSINQMKTALVEACINAAEHSLSPDGKIYQRFRIEDDRVVLTVSNRGLRLVSQITPAESPEGRRGWGLKLMRQLMDEVKIENVDDGTRIVMTKYLRAA